MEITYWIVAFIFLICLIATTPQFNDYMRSKSKDRRKMCLTDSMSNVRIVDTITGAEYRPLSILNEGDTTSIDAETTKGVHTQRVFTNLNESDLKHSAFETIHTGKIYYRLVEDYILKNETINNKSLPGTSSEKYTPNELNHLYAEKDRIIKQLMGENMQLKATQREKIDDAMNDVAKLAGAKYGEKT